FLSPLSVGQTLRIDFDPSEAGGLRISFPGFELDTPTQRPGNHPDYVVSDVGTSSNGRDTGVGSSSDGAQFRLTRTGDGTYLASLFDIGTQQSARFTGALTPGQIIDYVDITVSNSGPRGPGSSFFNN